MSKFYESNKTMNIQYMILNYASIYNSHIFAHSPTFTHKLFTIQGKNRGMVSTHTILSGGFL